MQDHQQPVIVIVGPTAVGKTAVSLALVERLPIEIISADSRQIYRWMDVGTAKPSSEEQALVPHHFVGELDPATNFNAGEFMQQARKLIPEIVLRRRQPVVVGGSGLYVRALLEGFFEAPSTDYNYRKKLDLRVKREGVDKLYQELMRIDPDLARETHPQNVRRIVRGLEVYHVLGKPMTRIQREQKNPASFSWIKFGLRCDREVLYRRIEARVDRMIDNGLVDEVRSLLDKGYSPHLNALNSVGYKEIVAFLKGQSSLDEAIEQIKRNTRRFAKRQMTWFRSEKDVRWIDIINKDDVETAANLIVSAIAD